MSEIQTNPDSEDKYIGITELRNAIAARMKDGKRPAYYTIRAAMRKGLPYIVHPVNERYSMFLESQALAWWFDPAAREAK